MTGSTPAVWGQEFGFARDGDMDGTNFRSAIVEEESISMPAAP